MGQARKVSDEQIAAALEKHRGILAYAARDLGISRQGLHKRL